MDDAEPLSPCPFCGSADVVLSGDHLCRYAVCRACGANGPIDQAGASAADLWNRRVDPRLCIG